MPNECYNTVRLSGSEELIQKLDEAKFSLQTFLPPPEFSPTQTEDLIEWRYEHWGTKWDVFDYSVKKKGKTGIEVTFCTAWSPPIPFFKHLMKQYPETWIKCDWVEEGGMAGVYVSKWDKKENKIETQELIWDDWCLEEYAYHFRDTN
jgi:hypothetical protein